MATFPFSAAMERLESRLAPAGMLLLSTSGGVLSISGDGEANGIAITEVLGADEWTISDPLGGTSFMFNGSVQSAPFNIPAQEGIRANLKDGNDILRLQGSAEPAGLLLSKGLQLAMGDGSDEIELNPAGGFLAVLGAVNLDLGSGNDTVQVASTALFQSAFKLMGGSGDDTVGFAAGASFLKGLSLDLGSGVDLVSTDGLFNVQGKTVFKTGGSADGTTQIAFQTGTLRFDGPVSFQHGSGGYLFSVTADARFADGFKFSGGSGNDLIDLRDQIQAGGAVLIDFKGGNNELRMDDTSVFQGTSLTVKGGSDSDVITQLVNQRFDFSGAVKLQLGGGSNVWNAASGSTLIAGSLNWASGAGDDNWGFRGDRLQVLGSMALNLGSGTNTVHLQTDSGFSVGGNLDLGAGGGQDWITVDSDGFQILGNLGLKLGGGSNRLTTEGAEFHVAGGVSYAGGTGDDQVTFASTNLTVGRVLAFAGGAHAESQDLLDLRPEFGVLGALNYRGGQGTDFLRVGHVDGTSTQLMQINGSLTLRGGGGSNDLAMVDAVLQGSLNFQSEAGTGSVDRLNLRESQFWGAVNLRLGAGSSDSRIDDVLVAGNVLYDGGGGADTLSLDTDLLQAGRNRWLGTVRILGGSGDDLIKLGSAMPPGATLGNDFHRTVIVDGGSGTDFIEYGQNTYYDDPPFVVNLP